MPDTIRDELQSFATALLERRGGLVDWPAGAAGGTAIVPPEVAGALESPSDVLPITTEPGRGPSGWGWTVNLAGDFLETAGRVLDLEPRIGDFELPDLYLKRGTLDAAVERAFGWLNAKVTMADTRLLTVEYHTWWFRAAIASEDRWETRLSVTLNAASGVEIDLPDPLGQWGLRPRSAAGRPTETTYERAVGCAIPMSAQRRPISSIAWTPGWRPIAGGYRAITARCCARPGRRSPAAANRPTPRRSPPTNGRLTWNSAASWPSLTNVMQWNSRWRRSSWCGRRCPCWWLICWCSGSARRTHAVYWNPLLKQLEPMRCSVCGKGAFGLAFTDEQVEPVCAACWRQGHET